MQVHRTEEQKRTIAHIVKYYKYGDTVSDNILSELLGYNIRYNKQYDRYIGMMNRIKNQLLEYQYVIKRVKNGWYILKPSQISSYVYRKNITKASNTIKRGVNIIKNVDKAEVSSERLDELNCLQELAESLDQKIEQTIKISKYYSRKGYFDTLEDI